MQYLCTVHVHMYTCTCTRAHVHVYMHTYALCGYTRHLRTCWYAAIHVNRAQWHLSSCCYSRQPYARGLSCRRAIFQIVCPTDTKTCIAGYCNAFSTNFSKYANQASLCTHRLATTRLRYALTSSICQVRFCQTEKHSRWFRFPICRRKSLVRPSRFSVCFTWPFQLWTIHRTALCFLYC